jgi:MFS family permease
MFEGLVYFGFLGYLSLHFSDFIFEGVENPNELAHDRVMILTGGITLAMLFLGKVADKKGIRFALVAAFACMLVGRSVMSAAPTVLGLEPDGAWSTLDIATVVGILIVVIGYGMYQPAAYAAVKKFTTPKTAGMGFAMIYAVMNLGGWFPTFAFLLRDEDFLGIGISGVFWVYTGITALALLLTYVILTRKTVQKAITAAKAETAALEAAAASDEKAAAEGSTSQGAAPEERRLIPVHLWIFIALMMVAIWFGFSAPWNYIMVGVGATAWLAAAFIPASRRWLANHPLGDGKFFYFIFALIPVQTLFTYNWLVLPAYIKRAYEGWIGEYFEIFANANPLLIFIAAPFVAAVTQKRKVYHMMITGTFVMAAPAFLLVSGPHPAALIGYIVLMTIGEAMWQPRFLQYAAEIAPEGRTGEYMGVAQLPWFLTKVLVPFLYSGWMMDRYCPAEGDKNTEFMWLVFACIAMCSTVLLLVAKRWIGREFKTKA